MIRKLTLHFSLAALALSALAAPQGAPEVVTRQLWDATLIEKRPTAPAAEAGKKASPSKRGATPPKPSAPVKGMLVGVTVWSFRPSKPADSREVRALIHESDGDVELTPERVAADQPLAEGQKLRIGIEVSQEGYLYVIDRDEYADGTRSDPYLIYPASSILGGSNKVRPGMLVEIPAASDQVPYFKMQRTKPNQTQEVLSILISPKPIPGLVIAERQKLEEAQLAAWEKQWKVKSYQLGDSKDLGKTYTVAEKQAAGGDKALGKDDPLPQLKYYLDTRAGSAGMVELPLRIGK